MSPTKEDEEERAFRVTDRRGQPKEQESVVTEMPAERKPRKDNASPSEIDFSTFVVSMSTSAMIHLGLVENPHTRKKDQNLPLARQEVDILGMLEEKTRGNLTPDEKQLIDQVLYELRLRFVETTK